ncbi:MAG: cytochrome b/b6 domain-containing protein [Acidobacteriota bacterium]
MSSTAFPAAAPPSPIPLTADERVVVIKHHWLVRLTHWLNLAVLAALIGSGLSIYWASPVFTHAPNPRTGSRDYVGDVSVWLAHHLPFAVPGPTPRDWLYNHLGIGTFALAQALQIHWLFAYLFMLIGAMYVVGLLAGGGWRSLMPHRADVAEALAMIRYYLGLVPMKLLRRPWPHPHVVRKYNALQRSAYLSMPLFGALAIASGWAMHKPAQLGWLERMFGSYDGARIVHFAAMLVFLSFVIPHVILVLGDGWDTMRSMIAGWSERLLPTPALAGVPASVVTAGAARAIVPANPDQAEELPASDSAASDLMDDSPDQAVVGETAEETVSEVIPSEAEEEKPVAGDSIADEPATPTDNSQPSNRPNES